MAATARLTLDEVRRGLAWRKQDLLVADPHANAVFEIAPDGKVRKMAVE